MNLIQPDDFRQFFFELHGKVPFPWQERLAVQVCSEGWPAVIDLPTASGKTACIDIALFALAVRGDEGPRRIFFVVDRRVIVSEAFLRAKCIRKRLVEVSGDAFLKRVADRFRELANGEKPLRVAELRGGAYRDETWVRTPLQPTVVTSTVDQIGSRLLFRGYGINPNTWPLHAGLIANDALIFLDEAHCSKSFAQTLEAIQQYRGDRWAASSLKKPFQFIEMTATPSRGNAERFQIAAKDREQEFLGPRIYAKKPVDLNEIKCRKDERDRFAGALIDKAIRLADAVDAKRIAIMVNRVATAKRVHQKLKEEGIDALLVIGRMRPIDRDELYKQCSPLKSNEPRKEDDQRRFVISTQCLEVGADLDFDVLVSECASIEALVQRFGRLDRLGQFDRARGGILIGSWQLNTKDDDPVYGEALRETWTWLGEIAATGPVNMGIAAPEGDSRTVAELLQDVSDDRQKQLRMLSENAPILLPAHLDALVQTNPTPEPEPLIALFLHGPGRGEPDVQVVWREDLNDFDPSDWQEIVGLCPPSSREAMPVQIGTFRRWFAGKARADETESDVEGARTSEDDLHEQRRLPALIWRGDTAHSRLVHDARDVRPGDTIVLRASDEGWNDLGYIPDGWQIDVGDRTRFDLRRGVSLRLHAKLIQHWPDTQSRRPIEDRIKDDDLTREEAEDLLRAYGSELEGQWPADFLADVDKLSRRQLQKYPNGEGYVLQGRIRHGGTAAKEEVSLDDHLHDVEEAVEQIAARTVEPTLLSALKTAARFHDYGKADLRYQAWLRGGDSLAAFYAPRLIAKSGRALTRRQQECGLPEDFRHELVSLVFAAKSNELKQDMRELTLHLIASHHGRCRPFAPVVPDDGAECLTVRGLSVCQQERIEGAAHKISSGISDRFWNLTRRYGWWGLAYLEALLRLADWKASSEENAEVWE